VDERSACLRDLYLTAQNNHNRQTFMPQDGFEPAIPASERPQTHPLEHVAPGTVQCNVRNSLTSNSDRTISVCVG